MKLSVSLPEEDVEFVDRLAEEGGFSSRSAVLQRAIRVLRDLQLSGAYEEAWQEWDDSQDGKLWDNVIADGV